MAPTALKDLVASLPTGDTWGPPISSETTLDGVPYAPFSKGDKLGRMADWTEGKDRDRGGRQNYGGRGYRGSFLLASILVEKKQKINKRVLMYDISVMRFCY